MSTTAYSKTLTSFFLLKGKAGDVKRMIEKTVITYHEVSLLKLFAVFKRRCGSLHLGVEKTGGSSFCPGGSSRLPESSLK
jgi:hypothetical protein